MGSLKIAICDDEPEALDRLKEILESANHNTDFEFFLSGRELADSFYPGKYDIIILDIYMEEMDGVETAEMIRAKDMDVPIAFVTASNEHALDAYRLKAIRYIQKPYQKDDIAELLYIAREHSNTRHMLTLQENGQREMIPIDHILYVEQDRHSIVFHLSGDRLLTRTGKLDDLEIHLPNDRFFRSHKSFLVNLQQVNYLDKTLMAFEMKSGERAFIRRSSLKQASEAYSRLMFNKTRSQSENVGTQRIEARI